MSLTHFIKHHTNLIKKTKPHFPSLSRILYNNLIEINTKENKKT